jgi:hypothetical protein
MRILRIASLLLGVLAALLLTGCRTRYELTLTNANRITAYSKPKNEQGWYVFKDANGKPARVPAMRVLQIEALSPWDRPEDPFRQE